MNQSLGFLGDFKLGHYMNIPPKSNFIAQLVGTIVASTVYFCTAWWLLSSIENICDKDLLPMGSPWTCPGEAIFYNASIIWGVVGPHHMFGSLGLYDKMNWFFLFGILAPVPVWLLTRAFPKKKWLKLINVPVILGGAFAMPSAKTVHYTSWFVVGIAFNFIVYRRYKAWWARYNYVLSTALDAGVAFMGLITFFALQSHGIHGLNWWEGEVDDHCPLAKFPTAPGVIVPGCPVF